MHNLIRVLIIPTLVFPFWSTAHGQAGEPLVKPEHQIEAARKTMRTERRLIIAGELFLTSEESDAFWPLFREYEAKLAEIGDARVRLITDYAENFETLTPEHAARLLDESLDIDARQIALRQRYVKKFKKVLPAIKVVRLYQIDSKLEAAHQYQLAATIPLVQEAGP